MTEIAEAEQISRSYVSRTLRLVALASDLVEANLGGWANQRDVGAARAAAAGSGSN